MVCVTSFLLGILFTHWIADSLTLWKSPVTDSNLWASALYYSVISRGPAEILYACGAVALAGGFTILWSLRDGEAGNLMFDGGSIFLYATAIAVYLHTVLPNIRLNFISLPPFSPIFPSKLRTPTLELASSHLVCSVALTGVLALQAGRWWAENNNDGDEDHEEGR